MACGGWTLDLEGGAGFSCSLELKDETRRRRSAGAERAHHRHSGPTSPKSEMRNTPECAEAELVFVTIHQVLVSIYALLLRIVY